jgi:hypothetical protein
MKSWDTITCTEIALCIKHAYNADPTRGAEWRIAFDAKAQELGFAPDDFGHEIGRANHSLTRPQLQNAF